MTDDLKILCGDALAELKKLPDECVQCCVTSPPYFGLRDYKVKGQIGLEKSPQEYVAKLVEVFAEVRRVLKNDGTLWLNLGDSFWGSGQGFGDMKTSNKNHPGSRERQKPVWENCGLKPKDLIGIPWRVAIALQADGWYLRSDIIWSKPNCMPESVTDRPTRSHEYIFLLTKSARYFYDDQAIREPAVFDVRGDQTAARKARQDPQSKSMPTSERNGIRPPNPDKQRGHSRRHAGFNDRWDAMSREEQCSGTRNKRDVWSVPPAQYREAHFATFPEDLIKPCILAGSRCGDVILDPFSGSGTTGAVSLELGRRAILIELNPDYIELIKRRTDVTMGLKI